MYKNEFENIEIYFICEEEGEELVNVEYNNKKDIHYWYFNSYLCYLKWKTNFKGLKIKELTKNLLTIGASRYLIFKIENAEYQNLTEYQILLKDLKKIQPQLKKIINDNEILLKL